MSVDLVLSTLAKKKQKKIPAAKVLRAHAHASILNICSQRMLDENEGEDLVIWNANNTIQ